MPELEETARKYALQNALLHGGKASPGAVMGKIMAEMPEMRSRSAEVMEVVKSAVSAVNSMSTDEQRKELEVMAPELLEKKKAERREGLPPLEDVGGNGVVMRFAPNPSGPLHIGHSRVVILNDEYVRKYGGKFIVRMEDTNPAKVYPEAYDMIPEDMDWIGAKVHEYVIQSDRFDLYYKVARELLESGHAYMCDCDQDEWREKKAHKIACPHRDQPLEKNLEMWGRMFSGDYAEGEVSFVIKTDINHPNPALRDFSALRIVEEPHPRKGTKYRIYPLMNLSVAVDDHYLGLTHVLRGKDHQNNTFRQEYIFNYMGWKIPHYIHYGRVKIEGAQLSTSVMKEGIMDGTYTGWDDVRLGTLRALKRRGIRPEAIRKYWVEVGVKQVDIQFSWENLFAYNREIIEPEAERYFFVADPVRMEITGAERITGEAPILPNRPENGYRTYNLKATEGVIVVYAPGKDVGGKEGLFRLKDLCNIEIKNGRAIFAGNDLAAIKKGAKIIHWTPADSLPGELLMPEGTKLTGLVERGILQGSGEMVQFERMGFARIEKRGKKGIKAVFAHR